ncbi:nucleotide disphospho-sugar-binding domain-containing protein, partial [Enterovirga sp.]|uniref:glycosyltransferase n=1 Tax=Enterovirga sp. TaxID=2026350 RepID=UPI00261F8101
MAHLAFIAPPFRGHMDPMQALAREILRRGHRATFLHMPDAQRLITDEAIGFRAVGHVSHPAGHLAAVTRRMARIEGFFGLPGIIRDVAAATDMLCRELPGALRAVGADMVVCDGTEAAGVLVAQHLGLPAVTVANALPLNREPDVPPPFTGWRYDPGRWGRERNLGGYRVSDLLMRPHGRVIAAYAERWKLGPRRHVADCLSGLAQISQTVAGFDFPRRELPEVFHHVGPIRDPAAPDRRAEAELPPPDGRPLAYASLGTLQGGRVSLFRRIAAAGERAGFRLVIAHGGRMSAGDAARLPGSPTVHAFVPQGAVLAEADLAILNGGLNTVMDALAAGVPVLALPIAFEQGAIAARLEWNGAGRKLSRRFLGVRRLAREVDAVGRGPSHRVAAAGLAAEIAAAGGVSRAADIVERVLATGRPVGPGERPAAAS